MRRRPAALDPDRPRTTRHEGPAWTVEAVHLLGRQAPVAAKRPRRAGFHATTLLEAEWAVARSARHDRLVQAVALADVDGQRALCLAPCCPGSLAELVTPPLDPGAAAGLVVDVAGALAALHGAGWVHGRIDATHVLVGLDGRAVLAGLGGARRAPAAGGPEAGTTTPGPTTPDDVAALAHLVTGLLEPSATDPGAVGLRSVLRRMADDDPGQRPTAATAAELATRFGPPARPLAPPGRTTRAPDAEGAAAPPTAGLARPDRPGRSALRRAAALGVVAVGFVALGLRLLLAPSGDGTGPPPSAPCPLDGAPAPSAGVDTAVADVDGRGCSVPVRWSASTGVLEVVTPEGLRRYALGGPGDRLVLGDWDCDGRATPVLVRPGEVVGWRYPRWPTDDEPVPGDPVPLDGPGGAPPPPRCP